MPFSGPINRERLALLHAALVVVTASWLLGGMGPRGEWIVAAIASPSFLLLAAEGLARRAGGDRPGLHRLLRWCAPLAALSALVLLSASNPSHRPTLLQETLVLRPVPHLGGLPASALPAASLRLLACLGGLAATGLTLAFCVQSRRALRRLLLFLSLHAAALAVLGTFQQQTGAMGPYFGAVPRDHPAWFATFLYHNHWGSFALLHLTATLGLLFHSLRPSSSPARSRSPGPLLALCALLLAASIPLSTSRSTTVLMLLVLLAAAVGAVRQLRTPGASGRSRRAAWLPLTALLLSLGLAATQGGRIIAERFAATPSQLLANEDYDRSELYADTWRMALDRPLFGWGLESYGPIFLRYSSFTPRADGIINTFVDAHSDWLQSLAELGFVGTALLLALGLAPLIECLRVSRPSTLPCWLLGGCLLLAAYAWLEFPFANPAVVASWWIFWFAGLRLLQLRPESPV